MVAKLLIVITLLAILYALGSSFYFLVRDQGQGRRTVRRLTWRVGLSLLLILALLAAMAAGLIQPGRYNPVQYPVAAEPQSPGP